MRRRAPRKPSHRDTGSTDRNRSCAAPVFNRTTACLCCLVLILFLIQALVGLSMISVSPEDVVARTSHAASNLAVQRRNIDMLSSWNQSQTIKVWESKHKNLPSSTLPAWIQYYLAWHKEQRAKFPGRALWDDPSAPKLLIRTCLGLCGGLNDRLGQLPWDLYLANQTNRLLLLHWHRPVSIEEFLLPGELDWRVPREIPGFFGNPRVSRKGMQAVRNIKELFEGYPQETGPEELFWSSQFDAAMERAISGDFKDERVLRHRLLGHLDAHELEKRLHALGETDMLHTSPTFGNIFRMFFKLNPSIQEELDLIFLQLKLRPTLTVFDDYPNFERFRDFQPYSGVHCRVRHPKATPKNVLVKGKHADYPADRTGLPWEGSTRDFGIETASRALQCAQTLLNPHEPECVYFFSDSNDLVRFMAHELSDPRFLRINGSLLDNPVAAKARVVVQSMHVVARQSALSHENAHIDRQKGRDAPSYYATFLDLYLAIYARCITFGVGKFAVLAMRISGTECTLRYQAEAWGVDEKDKSSSPMCELIDN